MLSTYYYTQNSYGIHPLTLKVEQQSTSTQKSRVQKQENVRETL